MSNDKLYDAVSNGHKEEVIRLLKTPEGRTGLKWTVRAAAALPVRAALVPAPPTHALPPCWRGGQELIAGRRRPTSTPRLKMHRLCLLLLQLGAELLPDQFHLLLLLRRRRLDRRECVRESVNARAQCIDSRTLSLQHVAAELRQLIDLCTACGRRRCLGGGGAASHY